MATVAEYSAALKADLTNLRSNLRTAREELTAFGAGVPATGFDQFISRTERGLSGIEAAAQKVAGTTGSAFISASNNARAMGTAVEQLTGRIAENKAAMALQGAAINDSREKMLDLARSIETAKNAETVDADAVKKLQAEYKALSLDTRALSLDKAKLANDTAGLRVVLDAEKSALKEEEAAMRAARAEAERVAASHKAFVDGIRNSGPQLTSAGQSLTLGVTVPLVGLSAVVLKTGADFDKSMNVLAAQSGEAKARIGELGAQAVKLGADMTLPATSANDAAKAMLELVKAGLSVNDTISASQATLRLAAAAQIDEAQAAQITAISLQQFGLAGTEAAHVTDLLAAAASSSSAEIVDVANALKYAGPVAKDLKISIDDTVTAITELALAGIKGEQAGTALRGVLTDLNPTSRRAKEEMKALGVEIFDANGKMKPFVDVIDIMHGALEKLSDKQREYALQLIFGKEQMTAASVIFGQGADKFRELASEVTKAGVAQEQAAARSKGLGGAIDGLVSQVETIELALSRLGSGPLEDFVRKLADALPKIVQTGIEFAAANPKVSLFGATLLATAAVAGPVLIGLGSIVTFLGGPLSLGIAAGIVAIAGLATAYVENTGGMRDAVDGLVRQVVPLFDDLSKVVGFFGSTYAQFSLGVQGDSITLATVVKATFQAMAEELTTPINILRLAIATIKGDYTEAWKVLAEISNAGAKETVTATQSGLAGLPNAWQSQLQQVKDMLAQANGVYAAAGRSNAAAYMQGLASAGLTGGKLPFLSQQAEQQKGFFETVTGMGAKMTGQIFTPKVPGGDQIPDFRKHGQALGKALVDGFTEGVGGFDRALALIQANTSKLPQLLDPTTKQFKQQGSEMERALSAIAKNVNDFLSAAGVNAKVTVADLTLHWREFQGVLAKTDAFEHVKDAINQMNLQRLNAGLADLDASLKVSGNQITVSAQTFELLKSKFPGVVAEMQKVGFTTKEVFPAMVVDVGKAGDKVEEFNTQVLKFSGSFADPLQLIPQFTRETSNAAAAIGVMDKSMREASEQGFKALEREVPGLKESLKQLKEAVEGSFEFDKVKIGNEAADLVQSILGEFTKEGERMGLTGQELMQHALDGLKKVAPSFPELMKDVADKSVEQWKRGLEPLPGIWEQILHDLDSTSRHQLNDLFAVVDSFPGKWGDALRKTRSTVEQFLTFLNSTVKLIQNLMGDKETGLAGILSGIFKSTQQAAQSSTGTILDSVGGIIKSIGGLPVAPNKPGFVDPLGIIPDLSQKAGEVAGAATKAGAEIGKNISSGIGSFLSSAGGIMAAVTGALALFTSTFQSDSKAIRFAGAAAGGGLLGGFLSMIFGGPSELQKAQMAAQLQQARDAIKLSQQSVLQAIETTKQSMLTTLGSALNIAPLMAEFDGVSKTQINKVFTFLNRVVDRFLEAAKRWVGVNVEQTKQISEMVGSVFGALGALPAAANAFTTTPEVNDAQMDNVFSILDRTVARWEARADQWIEGGASKRVMKVADRLAGAVNLISPLAEGVAKLNDLKEVGDDKFAIIEHATDNLVDLMNRIAEKYDKSVLKSVQSAAEKIQPVIEAESGMVDLLTKTVNLPVPNPQDAQNLVTGMTMFTTAFIEGFKAFDTAGITATATIVSSITPMFDGVDKWLEISAKAKDATTLGVEKWTAIVQDVQTGQSMLHLLTSTATDIKNEMAGFDADMTAAKISGLHGFEAFADLLTGGASIMGGLIQGLGGGVSFTTPGGAGSTPGGASYAPTSYAPSSFTTAAAPSSSRSTTIIQRTTHIGQVIVPPPTSDDLRDYERFREYMDRWLEEADGGLHAGGFTD